MTANPGKIVSIRGSVVDVLFSDSLSEPRRLLKAGETIDGQKPLSQEKWRSLHASLVPLCDRATTTDIFLTRIKAIDVLAPLEKGGKAGLFGGAGVGKTVLITELIHNYSSLNLACPKIFSAN